MTTKTFYKTYDLKNLKIIEISPYNGYLSIEIEFDVDIQYIANGFRPAYDTTYSHRFVFKGFKFDTTIESPVTISKYELFDDKIILNINDIEYIIPSVEITAINNH